MTQSSTLVFPLLVLLCTLHSTSVIAPVNVDHSQHFPQDSSSLPACGLYVQSPDKLGLTYARPMVPLKHIGYNLEIVNGLAHITLKQQYYNPSAIFMDVYYSFSINPGSSVYKMVAQFGNKVVEGVVKQKEEARKQFEQAKEEGKQAVLTNLDQNSKDIIRMEIGNIPPQTAVTVTVSFVQEMTLSVSTFYRIQILSTISPRYANWVPQSSIRRVDQFEPLAVSTNSAEYGKPGFTWSFRVVLKAYREISFYNSTTHKLKKVSSNSDNQQVVLSLEEQSVLPTKDFVFVYTTKNFQLPSYVLGKNENSSTIMVSFIPKFSQLSDQEAYKTLSQNKDIEVDISAAKGEFIFILDRSGSMDDYNRIQKAKQALTIFLKSLPEDSYFNVISFGSGYQAMFPKSRKYENSALKESTAQISAMGADLGGTQIYQPLEFALNQEEVKGYPRFVFLLTDGQVQNTEGVIQMAKQKSRNIRINSIGIGNGASVRLIEGTAESGKGKHVMITDDEDPSKKIINLLESAISPLITSLNLVYDQQQVQTVIPNPNKLSYILKDNVANFYLLLDQELKQKTKVVLEYEDSLSKKVFRSELVVDPSRESFAFVDKMAHFKVLRALQDLSRDTARVADEYLIYRKVDANNDIKREAELYSVKHQILSEYTSFIAVVKQLGEGKSVKEVGYLPIVIQQPLAEDQQQQDQQPVQLIIMPRSAVSSMPLVGSVRNNFVDYSLMTLDADSQPYEVYPQPQIVEESYEFQSLSGQDQSEDSLVVAVYQDQSSSGQYQSEDSQVVQVIQDQAAVQKQIISKQSVSLPSNKPIINVVSVNVNDVVNAQNVDGSWSDQTFMTKLLDQCNCQAKQNINELTKTIRSDIILTKLVIEWMRNQQLDQQYSLILKKAESWLRKAVASEKVDESKLKELQFV